MLFSPKKNNNFNKTEKSLKIMGLNNENFSRKEFG
jgi:hypothetical protein